jgi:hypothetical protein
MFTVEQIIEQFIAKGSEAPMETLADHYVDYTQEQLDEVIARSIAIKNDPTFLQRLAEDHQKFLAASKEERENWQHITPNS